MCNKTEDYKRIHEKMIDYTTEYSDMVNQIASEYSKRYPMVERDDIKQQIWLWFVEHPRNLSIYVNDHEPKDSDRLIAKSLRNAAHDYCIKEKANKEGYNPNDNFWYTKDFIKMMIPGVLTDNWEKLEVALTNMGRSTKAPSESGDWMAYGADIRAAFDKLEEREQNLVFLFYAQDMDSKELHEVAQEDRPTHKATAMAANRALNKMVNYLGGFNSYDDPDYDK